MASRQLLLSDTDRFEIIPDLPVSWLAHAVWASDVNLQSAFDLNKEKERRAFLTWLAVEGAGAFGLDASLLFVPQTQQGFASALKSRAVGFAKPAVRGLVDVLPASVGEKVRPFLRQQYLQNVAGDVSVAGTNEQGGMRDPAGLNMVGYARSSLGLGEHLRTMVSAYATQTNALTVLDSSGLSDNAVGDDRIADLITDAPKFEASHVVCAAEQMIRVLGAHGVGRFLDYPLIATWAWELEQMPSDWTAIAKLVDRFWVASPFIGNAIKKMTDTPVAIIPPAVEPGIPSDKGRGAFDIPSDQFTFLAHFDCRSWLGRKNPFAVVRAFKQAFPHDPKVGLVLKAMSVDKTSEGWKALMGETAHDDRIRIIEETLPRGDMLALMVACDAYVSLHRSEGFGFGPAEALYFAKPTVVTDYSATADFCDDTTAFPVRYDQVPVQPGDYPHHVIDGAQQHWAEASIDHAAQQMQRIVNDPQKAQEFGKAGQTRMRQDYSAEAIGRLMADDLRVSGV